MSPGLESLDVSDRGRDCRCRDHADARDRLQPQTDLACVMVLSNYLLDSLNTRLQFVDLAHDQLDATANRIGKNGGGGTLGEIMQVGDTPDPFGSNQPEFGELAAQGIDQSGTLPYEELARPVQHQARLLLRALDVDKSHRWPGDCLTDSLGVDSVVLAALYIRFNVTRRRQPGIVAERCQLPTPVMRGTAGLHADQARRQSLEEFEQLCSPELLTNDNLAGGIDAVNLKNVFCEIKTNGDRTHVNGSLQ